MLSKIKLVFALVCFAAVIAKHESEATKIVCYMTNWSQYRPGAGKFFPEDVDPKYCTHVIYAFAKLENNELKAFEWNDDDTEWSKGLYTRLMGLKQKNPALKILIAVGGWNLGSELFTAMVNSPANRAHFVRTSIDFLKQRNFDGLDLDWEYPGNRGSPPGDKFLFTDLCKELKEAYKPHGLLLTAALGAGKATVDSAYEIDKISQHLDFLNLMSYDLHGAWEKFTGHNSPLRARKDETDATQMTLNVEWATKYLIALGCPKEKLIVGLATYGRTFTLADSSKNELGAPALRAGKAGKKTREAGFLAYYEICTKVKDPSWKKVWNEESQVPFITKGDQWIGYDNVRSLTAKANYIKEQGYGGGMFWALDLDDFNGQFCGEGKYPLVKRVYDVLTSDSVYPDPTEGTIIEPAPETENQQEKPDEQGEKPDEQGEKPNEQGEKPDEQGTGEKTNENSGEQGTNEQGETGNEKSGEQGTNEQGEAGNENSGEQGTDEQGEADNEESNEPAETPNERAPNHEQCTSGDGYYPNKEDGCHSYYRCINTGKREEMVFLLDCPGDLLFDSKLNICNYASAVEC